MVFFDLMPILQ